MIQPPFTLYTLSVRPTTMNSTAAPAVALHQADLSGHQLDHHILTPAQARQLAADLLAAADSASS
ncbi:MAG: hypothetical protein NVV66_01445 [Cellulomonas sp.]|uniref:hypothetical protein n=1 Tax=Cellulomonas sp. TaxID=40001 RepID=UPI002589F11D|nr:hypothetical protein [Cellulomonas sp.]MCR6703401.1 hypothetical protein [Cellulomonas sp.]